MNFNNFGSGLPGMEEAAGLPKSTGAGMQAFSQKAPLAGKLSVAKKPVKFGQMAKSFKTNVANQLAQAPQAQATVPQDNTQPAILASMLTQPRQGQGLAAPSTDMSAQLKNATLAGPISQTTLPAPQSTSPAPNAAGTGMMQGVPPAGGTGQLPSPDQMQSLPAIDMMGQAGTPIPSGMDMGFGSGAGLPGMPSAPGGLPTPGGMGGFGGGTPNPGSMAPPIGADFVPQHVQQGTDNNVNQGGGDKWGLADMLARSDDIYAQDEENARREENRMRRQAASMNALSGATGRGGFAMAGENAAGANFAFAREQAAAEHHKRQIDIQLSVLEKQLAQAEKSKDRDLERELADQIDAFKRDKLDIDSALTGEGEAEKEEEQKKLKVHSAQLEDKGGLTNGQSLDAMKWDLSEKLNENPNMTEQAFLAWLDEKFPGGPPWTDTDVINARAILHLQWRKATEG